MYVRLASGESVSQAQPDVKIKLKYCSFTNQTSGFRRKSNVRLLNLFNGYRWGNTNPAQLRDRNYRRTAQ